MGPQQGSYGRGGDEEQPGAGHVFVARDGASQSGESICEKYERIRERLDAGRVLQAEVPAQVERHQSGRVRQEAGQLVPRTVTGLRGRRNRLNNGVMLH